MPNSEIPWGKIAVFDINHGGLTIAKHLLKSDAAVTAFDVYEKASPEKRAAYAEEYGVPVSNNPNEVTAGEYDIVCLPVHLNPENIYYKKAIEAGLPMITHHEIVGRMIRNDPRMRNIDLIEITGVRGKTSTAVLLAQMLSFKGSVVLHTSEGVTYWKNGDFERIEPGISITPAYIPDLLETAFERKYMPNTFIFEISLGFTGAQDIGVLTEARPDYMIAGGTLSSTDAKTKMISRSKEGSLFVINYEDLEILKNYIREDQEPVVFDDSGAAIENNTPTDVYLDVVTGKDGVQAVEIESSRTGIVFRAEIRDGYDINAYKTAMTAAIATALELDVPEMQVTEVIAHFEGVKGRMRTYEEDGRIMLDNANSGLTVASAETGLKYVLEKYTDKKSPDYDPEIQRDVILVIGEENKTVCEGLEPADTEKIITTYREKIQQLILVGDRFKQFARTKTAQSGEETQKPENDLFGSALFAENLKEGLQKAKDLSKEGDLIVAAVKCFR